MLVPDTWSDAITQTHVWRVILMHAYRRLRGGDIKGALRAFVVGPGFYTTTRSRMLAPVPNTSRIRFLCEPTTFLKVYISVHFALALTAAYYLMTLQNPPAICLVYCPVIIISLAIQGLLLDGRSLIPMVEGVRCMAIAIALSRSHLLPVLDEAIPLFAACILAAFYAACSLLCLRLPEVLGSASGRVKEA